MTMYGMYSIIHMQLAYLVNSIWTGLFANLKGLGGNAPPLGYLTSDDDETW